MENIGNILRKLVRLKEKEKQMRVSNQQQQQRFPLGYNKEDWVSD